MAKQFKDISKVKSFGTDRKPRAKKSEVDVLEQMHQAGLPVMMEDDGSVVVDLDALSPSEDESSGVIDYNEHEHYRNLVPEVDPEELTRLSFMVRDNVELDKQSRREWESMIEQGTSLLGLKLEEKNTPFKGACSAHHPLLMESAVKFQSKASNELLPANGPVKPKILGEVTEEKEQQANRVAAHMNYQITEEMTEFYTDSEKLLLYLPLFGSGFKKTYYDSYLGRPSSEFVPADQLVVPNNASDLYRCERYTHILNKTKYQLEADFASGFYIKPDSDEQNLVPGQVQLTSVQDALNDIQGVEVSFNDSNSGYTLFEQHITTCIAGLDEEEDQEYEIAKHYVITVDSASGAVLGIRRNWKEGDAKKRKKVQFTHYTFVPGFGFYGFGFLHLLGNLQLSLTSSLRSLVDAGQFSNLQGGFKLKGVRILNDGEPIYPGQFKDVDSGILDINKSIMRLPFGEPSQVLYQMLEFLDRKGQKFADSTEQVIADATNYGPVGTTLALLDASTKFFSAIHKRLHKSLKEELKAIAAINAETLPDELQYNVENATMKISREDYDDTVDVTPSSDPNVSSNAHRMAKAQTILQVAQNSPEIHDMREVLKHFYINMDIGNIDKILPPPEEAQPQDPLTDIQLATQGKPIKAFEGQDHKSHIAIKQAFLNDPMSGKNQLMAKAAAALQANMQEHMMLSFMEQVKAQSGGDPNALAQAAEQVATLNQQKLAQEMQAQGQNAQDQAALLLAQAELLDTQIQAKKQTFEEKYKTAELALKAEQLDMEKVKEVNKNQQLDKKLMADYDKVITTKGLDAMIQGLQPKPSKPSKKD